MCACPGAVMWRHDASFWLSGRWLFRVSFPGFCSPGGTVELGETSAWGLEAKPGQQASTAAKEQWPALCVRFAWVHFHCPQGLAYRSHNKQCQLLRNGGTDSGSCPSSQAPSCLYSLLFYICLFFPTSQPLTFMMLWQPFRGT